MASGCVCKIWGGRLGEIAWRAGRREGVEDLGEENVGVEVFEGGVDGDEIWMPMRIIWLRVSVLGDVDGAA